MISEIEGAIAKGVSEAVTDLAKEITSGVIDFGKREIIKAKVDIEIAFNKIVERNYKRVHKIKTLINPGTPVSLESVFVSPNLIVDQTSFQGSYIFELLKEVNFAVLIAIAGSGKSMFLKHLYATYFLEKRNRIPVFVELRLISDSQSLQSYILASFAALNKIFTEEVFEYSLKCGKYAFLLDGFDEIPLNMRKQRANEIQDLAYTFAENIIVVSSRPDNIFQSWNEFQQVSIAGLTKEQVIDLVGRLRFNKERKKEFINRIDDSLYDSHGTYLSNPLLCTIMLLTFDQKAEIPSKMHIFFKMAFEALLFRHDTQKAGLYKREYKTRLEVDDFSLFCSSFSMFSYIDHGSSMKKEDAISCAQKSIEYDSLHAQPKDAIFDLCTSVSVAVEEGGHISYIHRSFQEYLAALFLATREISEWDKIVEKIHQENPNDNVVQLLSDLNPDKFRKQFLVPRLSNLVAEMKIVDLETQPSNFFRMFYISVGCREDRINYWTVGRGSSVPPWSNFLSILQRLFQVGSLTSMADFDWKKHAQCTIKGDAYNTDASGAVEPIDVNDEFITSSPMINHLRSVKTDIESLSKRIEESDLKKRKLMSDVFLSNRSIRKGEREKNLDDI